MSELEYQRDLEIQKRIMEYPPEAIHGINRMGYWDETYLTYRCGHLPAFRYMHLLDEEQGKGSFAKQFPDSVMFCKGFKKWWVIRQMKHSNSFYWWRTEAVEALRAVAGVVEETP